MYKLMKDTDTQVFYCRKSTASIYICIRTCMIFVQGKKKNLTTQGDDITISFNLITSHRRDSLRKKNLLDLNQ